MFLEILKPVSFILSILSLYPVVISAFFVPGTRWEERLSMSLVKIALAACVCFGSGLLFCPPPSPGRDFEDRIMSTLPVRLFCWTMVAVAVLFLFAWYLEEYYVPMLWRNQPH